MPSTEEKFDEVNAALQVLSNTINERHNDLSKLITHLTDRVTTVESKKV